MRELADGVEVTDGSGATTPLRRGRGRHPPRPGARDARVAHRPPARGPVRAALLAATRRSSTPTPRCCPTRPTPGRRGTSTAPRPTRPARRHGHLRPHPPPAAAHRHPLPRHPRRRGPRRPGDRHRPDGVRAPALHARVGGRVAPAARDQHRRGSPSPAPTTAGASTRTARARASRPRPTSACPGSAPTPVAAASRAASRRRSATRGARPFRRTFEHRSTFWLVDLDDLPDHGAAGALRGARPPRLRPTRTLRDNVESFLADHGVVARRRRRPGTILMAAHPRSLGHCFNPISVFWCFDDARRAGRRRWSRCTTPTATGTPTSSTPTSRGAPAPTRRCTSRPSTASTARTTSPCPIPTDRLAHRGHAARPRRRRRRARRSARRLTGDPQRRPRPPDPRRHPARQRADPRARHLAVGPPAAGPSPTGHDHPHDTGGGVR